MESSSNSPSHAPWRQVAVRKIPSIISERKTLFGDTFVSSLLNGGGLTSELLLAPPRILNFVHGWIDAPSLLLFITVPFMCLHGEFTQYKVNTNVTGQHIWFLNTFSPVAIFSCKRSRNFFPPTRHV